MFCGKTRLNSGKVFSAHKFQCKYSSEKLLCYAWLVETKNGDFLLITRRKNLEGSTSVWLV